jgi:phosphate transport system substrate-binding protein
MSFGDVKNPAGKFVKASPATVSAAAAGAAKNMPNDFRVSITNAPGAEAYPVSSFTWLLIPTKSQDAKKGEILRDFLKWMIAKGESEATGLAYAPLPESVATKVSGAINYLK